MELFLLDYMVYAKKTTSCSSCAEQENFGVSDVSSCPWPGSTTIVGHYLACCDWPMDVFVYFFLNFQLQRLERSHWLSSVVWYNSLKKRNCSLNLLLSKESDDTDLSQSSVIKLLNKSLSLLCLSLFL